MSLLNDPAAAPAAGSPPPGSAPGAPPAGQSYDWRTELPEELRAEKSFEAIKAKDAKDALAQLGKGFVNAQRLVGAKGVIIPGDTATPEERAKFYTELGRPAKPEEYAPKLPEGITEEKIDKARMDQWKSRLYEQGLSKRQAEAIISEYIGDEVALQGSMAVAHTKKIETWELELKSNLGAKYDEELNYARLGLKNFGNPKITALLDETGLGSNPEVVMLFSAIGRKLSDDTARGGAGGLDTSLATPEGAQHALNEFNRNGENMKILSDPKHLMHAQTVARRTELFKAAFPNI